LLSPSFLKGKFGRENNGGGLFACRVGKRDYLSPTLTTIFAAIFEIPWLFPGITSTQASFGKGTTLLWHFRFVKCPLSNPLLLFTLLKAF